MSCLKQERKKHLKQALLKSNQEEVQDSEYQEELDERDATISNGFQNDSF